jgi:hypothetical protein
MPETVRSAPANVGGLDYFNSVKLAALRKNLTGHSPFPALKPRRHTNRGE